MRPGWNTEKEVAIMLLSILSTFADSVQPRLVDTQQDD